MLAQLGRGIQRFFAAWYRFVTTRKSNLGTAAAVLGSLFVVCCVGLLFVGLVNGPRTTTGLATGVPAAQVPTAAQTTAAEAIATTAPKPTQEPTSAPAPTSTAEPTAPPAPTNTPEPPTATPLPTDIPLPTTPPLPADQIRTAVERVLTKSNRNVERVTSVIVNPDEENPRIFVRWTINDNLTEGLIKAGARSDATNILKAIAHSGVVYREVLIEGTFPLVDTLGNTAERIVIHALYPRSTLDQVNWDNFLTKNVYIIADEVEIHPAFQE